MTGALLIFFVTYTLIAGRRIGMLRVGRSAAAAGGAAACVLIGVFTPGQAYGSIDGDTIVLLLAMMLLAGHLDHAGFFDWSASIALRFARTPQRLLTLLVFSTGIVSAFLVNDAMCFLVAPVLVRVIRRLQLGAALFLIALMTSANIGSVMTIVGNPQTMIVGSLSHLRFTHYFLVMAPLGLACLLLNRLLLPRFYPLRRRVPEAWARQADSFDAPFDDADELPMRFRHTMAVQLDPGLLLKCGLCLVLALVGWFAGLSVAWCAMGAAAVLLLITGWEPREAFRQVDWQLLLFVAGLFIVVGALRSHGASTAMLDALRPWIGDTPVHQGWALTLLSLLGCNIFGNIPFVLVGSEWMPEWSDPRLGAMILAMSSTFAGNLMITSSMANVLVRDAAADLAPIGFREHLRYGVVITLLTTLLGTLWILAVA